jgi:hypothetical protein
MNNVEMCDTATRSWCCRIGLVLSISAVLLTMMFQIWSYYFSLVKEMDNLSGTTPVISSIFSVCNSKIISSWNNKWELGVTEWKNDYEYNRQIFVDTNCVDGVWKKIPLDSCCRVIIWILPW